MKIKDLATDIRTYIFIFGLIVAIVIGITKFHKLPERVDKNVDDIQRMTNAMTEYSSVQQEYVAVNEEWKKGQQKSQELMLEIIRNK